MRIKYKNLINMKKGQIAFENFMLIGFIFAIMVPLSFIFLHQVSQNEDEININIAKNTLRNIVESANSVYISGPNSTREITVIYPSNLNEIKINEKELIFKIRGEDNQIYELVYTSLVLLDTTEDDGMYKINNSDFFARGKRNLIIKSKNETAVYIGIKSD